MTEEFRQVCDTCGQPATNAARDIRQTTQPTDSYHTYEPRGATRYGCDKHPTRSVMYDNLGRRIGPLTDDEGRPIPWT